MDNKTKVILGIVGAAAAGAVVGMLLAPEKGSELRKKIKEKGTGFGEDLLNWFNESKEELTNLSKKVEKEVSNLHQTAQDTYQKAEKRVS